MKGDYGFRKHCTADEVNGGYCVKNLGCISVKGNFIPRGENRTEENSSGCIVSYCLANGNKTSYSFTFGCKGTNLPPTIPPKPATEAPKTPVTLPPATDKTTKAEDVVTVTYFEETTKSTTGQARECKGGKKEGEEWDEQKGEDAPRFRKKCIIHPVDGYCVVIVGCYSVQTGKFIERGQNITESVDNCDFVSYCIANGETGTEFRQSRPLCGASTLLTRKPSTEKPTKPTKPDAGTTKDGIVTGRPVTDPPATAKPTKKEDVITVTYYEETTEGIVTGRPVTEQPPKCPNGKEEGDEWTEKNKSGDREFRKKCIDGCVVIIGCVSQKGTVVPRGTNKTEVWDNRCDLITYCLATDKTSTAVRDDLLCNAATEIPRTPSTGKPETVKSTEAMKPSVPTKATNKPTPATKPTKPSKATKPTKPKPTKQTPKPTPVTEPTPPSEKPVTDAPTKENPVITARPVTETPEECPNGKKEGEEWNEKKTDSEYRKKCVDGCIVIIGCISKVGTFVKRGTNHTEYWNERCDLVTSCIAVDKTRTQYQWNDLCNANTVHTRAPTTGKPFSPKKDTDGPTKSPTTESYTEKPGTGECPGGKKAEETWEDGRFIKKCTVVDDGHCVTIVGCLSAKNGVHFEKGTNFTEDYSGGCKRTTYCLDEGKVTRVVDGDLVCPAPSTPAAAEITERPATRFTAGPLVCPNGKKVGETWNEDSFVSACTTDDEGMVCIKKIACLTPLGHRIERGESHVETEGTRKVGYKCIADGDSTLLIQNN